MVEEFENLRGRFEKAVGEIRAMKRELRESHAHQDELELMTLALRQEAKQHEDGAQAQAQLMAARIEDLTQKLSAAERQVGFLFLLKTQELRSRILVKIFYVWNLLACFAYL